jgi:hypothetical protein
MKQCYRPIEIALGGFVARCGKVNLSQFLAIPVLMLLRHSMRRREHQQDSRNEFVPLQWRAPPARSTSIGYNDLKS